MDPIERSYLQAYTDFYKSICKISKKKTNHQMLSLFFYTYNQNNQFYAVKMHKMKTNEAIHLVTECPIHLVTECPVHLVTECPIHLVTECPILITLGYPVLMTLGQALLCNSLIMFL